MRTSCIITTTANELVAEIHDRMPVIVPPDAYERWLANIEPDPRDLLVPFSSEFDAHVADIVSREQTGILYFTYHAKSHSLPKAGLA